MNIKRIKRIHTFSNWIPLLLGIFITSAAAWGLKQNNVYEIQVYLQNLADKTENIIQQNFQHFEYGLRGVRGAMSAVGVENINREQFEHYNNSRNIDQEFSGALGFGFIRRVTIEQESQFISSTRKKVKEPSFNIKTLTPHTKDRYIIQHIYPLDKNRQALGLDIGSETNRRAAAVSAARNDKPYLTAPITLLQANNKPRKGALVLLPIYPSDINLTTPEERENSVLGWSYAPLVIDEVLLDLGLQSDEATVTLTSQDDNTPFYSSNKNDNENSSGYNIERDIYVLGQKWRLSISPSIKVIDQIKPWKINWVILLGLGLTLCVLLVINLLRSSELIDNENNSIYQLSLQSILAFLKSDKFKQSQPLYLILFSLIFSVSSWIIINDQFTDVSNNLSKTKSSAISILNNEVSQYENDVLFLAKTTMIQALKTLNTDGIDRKNNPLQNTQINDRLSDIFKAYMLSKINIHQVRLIGTDDNWKELVKVQRFGNELKTFKISELQAKESEPYIKKTLFVGDGSVFISDINLNREYGKIEKPNRPVWRFSTPLFYPNGQPLGIIIINTSANNILKSISESTSKQTELYITNTTDDFLLHPKKSKAFSFEEKASSRWTDDFHSIETFYGLNRFNLIAYTSNKGDFFVKETKFLISKKDDIRQLNIYTTTPRFLVYKKITLKILSIIFALTIFNIISFIIQYWVWLNEIIRHRENLLSQIEKQREKETIRFKGLLESAPDATFVIDEAGIIQMINAQAEKMFGYSRFDLEHKSIVKLVPLHLISTYKARMADYLGQRKMSVIDSGIELLAQGAGDNEFPIEVSLSSINLDNKVLISASVRNISERLAAEERLRNALHDAELATEAKSAFLANTSHEIRTPLNAIIGLAYLLSEENLTNSQHQLVSKIQISGKSLLGIVNDVLDLAKIEANEMELEEQPIELRELIEEVSGIFSVQAEAKDLDFNFEIDSTLPSWVIADNIRLRQILINLLSNALKFTAIGRIFLCVEALPKTPQLPENHIGIRLSIKDTGIGISDEVQSRLFKPFTQADSSTTRRFGGTGLGLSIVNQLVQMMGGKIGIESAENKGSKFWVELSFKTQSAEDITAQDNQNQTLFLLIAEDNPADAKQIQKMTRALGWRSEVVSNGDELVKAYLDRQENNLRPPDAMIVDWKMPVMNGVDAINTLANIIGRNNLPAILMVSSHDKESIGQYDHENLINNFLMKPVNSSTLFNSVNDVVTFNTGNSHRVMQSTQTQAVHVKWLPDVNVLVVDDSPINLVVVSHILEHNGAIVQTANSGEEAISLLEKSSDNYDAILMDVQMPGIDGLETTKRIRNHLEITSLPIIALTAGALLDEKTQALEAGMNDFLTKPINPSKLINTLRTLVETYRGKTLALESIENNTVEDSANTWPAIIGLNLKKAKSLLLEDKQLLFKTLDGLLTEYNNLATPPTAKIDHPDSQSLRLDLASQIHKLRSVSGMIGAEKIQKYATEAEHILRDETQTAKIILENIAIEITNLQYASRDILDEWKKEKNANNISHTQSPLLKLETLQTIMALLVEQDLKALEKIEDCSTSLYVALGDESYNQFQSSLSKLHYKDAIQLLNPLIEKLEKA